MTELSALAGSEGYGACDDEVPGCRGQMENHNSELVKYRKNEKLLPRGVQKSLSRCLPPERTFE